MNHRWLPLSVILVAVAGCLSLASASVQIAPLGVQRLPNGNTLIADGTVLTGNDSRALEVDSLGRLVWAYIKGDVPFLHTARRLADSNTLMSSSGGNKVLEVNLDGDRVWLDSSGLHYPNEAYRLANGRTLITDRDDNRVIEVTPDLSIVWSCSNLVAPHNGSRLANGNTLICNSDSSQVIEVDSTGTVVWHYATGITMPSCAQRLLNGNTLIVDPGHNRVIEVDSSGAIVWSAAGLTMPCTAVRLNTGNTLVSEFERVVELNTADSIVWQYPNTAPEVVETLWVVNPSSGCSLYVHIHRPAYAGPSNRVPGVIFVPGGKGYGSQLDSTTTPDDIASDGFAFMHFDPDGRGRSGAYTENYDGYVQQDGMHACESLLASRDYVDTSRLVVYTTGYGITMGSGMIARYPEPRIRFLLDFEGPADRYQSSTDSGGPVPKSVDSVAFWQEREAARFMKHVPGAYLRMQPQVDSNPRIPDNRHAIQLVDSATAVAYGGAGMSVWTQVNDSVMNPANKVYAVSYPPVWIPETQEVQNEVRAIIYLHQLAGLVPSGATERRAVGPAATLRAFPSPCRGRLQIGLPSWAGARELRVHDVCGRLVARTVVPAGSPQTTLDLRNLRPGVYYLSAAGAGTVPVVVAR
ncbi:MAG TPA: hypothetical protein VMH22_01785 [bacterium]|nr:hypothetical protein [bacterium]